jgi:ERCC4-type nuclease
MILQIDCREKDLIQCIDSLKNINAHFNEIEVVTRNLAIGDIIFYDEKNNTNKIIIERKTTSDLLASIKDGRYTEQSYRLDGNCLNNHNIIYMIEGDLTKINKLITKDKTTYYSSLISILYFKGFSVMRTYSLQESAFFICNSFLKICHDKKSKQPFYNTIKQQDCNVPKSEDDDLSPQAQTQQNHDFTTHEMSHKNYISVVKKTKKENITKDNIDEIMLSQIPGISSTTAICIINKYKSITNLINALSNDENCLKDICFKTSKGADRKINKDTGKIIKSFLIKD